MRKGKADTDWIGGGTESLFLTKVSDIFRYYDNITGHLELESIKQLIKQA